MPPRAQATTARADQLASQQTPLDLECIATYHDHGCLQRTKQRPSRPPKEWGGPLRFPERDQAVVAHQKGPPEGSPCGHHRDQRRFTTATSSGGVSLNRAPTTTGENSKHAGSRKRATAPSPNYWDHVQWVFGKETLDEFMEFARNMSIVGVVEQITVPFLITHGEDDTQIPLEYAQYDAAIKRPRRELKLFTRAEGGSMHASADNMSVAACFISDWVGEQF